VRREFGVREAKQMAAKRRDSLVNFPLRVRPATKAMIEALADARRITACGLARDMLECQLVRASPPESTGERPEAFVIPSLTAPHPAIERIPELIEIVGELVREIRKSTDASRPRSAAFELRVEAVLLRHLAAYGPILRRCA
jgi:hypothetical protein